jgi:hypothetical protein
MRLSPRREHRFPKTESPSNIKRDILNPGELGVLLQRKCIFHVLCWARRVGPGRPLRAPGGPGGVRDTKTQFIFIFGVRFLCCFRCDSLSCGNYPMTSVVSILPHSSCNQLPGPVVDLHSHPFTPRFRIHLEFHLVGLLTVPVDLRSPGAFHFTSGSI